MQWVHLYWLYIQVQCYILNSINASFVLDQHKAHSPLEVWTSCSEAQAVINIYTYGAFTEEDDQSHLDDVLHLGQRCTAALKEAQVSGCSCCCGRGCGGGAALYTHSETSGGTSSLFDEHKDSHTNTLSGLLGLFHDNTGDTKNFFRWSSVKRVHIYARQKL